MGDPGLEERCIVLYSFFELLSRKGIFKQGMIHDEIVEPHSVFLSFLPIKLKCALILLEFFIPLLLKLLLVEQRLPKETDISVEHVGVPAFFEGFVDFAHVPLEGLLIELLDIDRDEFPENMRNFVDFGLVIFEVELEGTEGDATVVESSDCELRFVEFRDHLRRLPYFIEDIIEVSH